MKLVRMILIVLVFSVVGGGFGALIGGLVGYGLPDTIPVHYSKDAAERGPDQAEVETGRTTTLAIGVGRPNSDESGASRGAALGAAIGLIVGLVLGIPLAIMDAFVAQIVDWVAKRKHATAA